MADSNDITEVSQPAAALNSDKTLVSSPGEARDTIVKPAPSSAAHTTSNQTQYTQFSQASNNSSGFAEAQAIAKQVHAGSGSGSLLKKRFLLEQVLGQGGMGTVYKTKDLRKVEAEDPHPYIATKVLNAAFKNHPDAFVTLQQETAKSHTLAHPNIVTVHDFDRDGDTLFMTMELLQGNPLDRLLKSQVNIPKPRALSIVRDLCAALAYAHQRHIIHADFKPGNVFICDGGTAKVLDFGIARAASKETQKHTFDAGQLGALTPAYATMEMVRDEPLTFADDVYALACVAYEIFSGQHPYQGHSALEARQLGLKPKPIAGLNHREWKALMRALALEKSQRTPTVPHFMADMFPRRNPLGLSVAVVLAVIALGGATWLGYRQYQAHAQLQITIADNIAKAQTCFAQSDFACALERSKFVANLDIENTVARQLAAASQLAQQKQQETKTINRLLAEGDACLAMKDDACAQVKAKDVLALDAGNLRAQQLLAAAADLSKNQNIAENIQQAESCLQASDITCATMFAKRAANIDAAYPAVMDLQQKLHILEQQGKLVALAQLREARGNLQQAQSCLAQKKYDCAISHADIVLGLDPANGPAMEVKQTAAVADKQIREAQEKVARILSQAKECLDKQKNYTCAIAKAEAALDVIPNNAEAIAVKTRAQDIQRKIKETGFTIK